MRAGCKVDAGHALEEGGGILLGLGVRSGYSQGCACGGHARGLDGRAEQIRAAMVMAGQLAHRRQLRLLGARSKAAQHHRIDHALAQRCHRRLQGPGDIPST